MLLRGLAVTVTPVGSTMARDVIMLFNVFTEDDSCSKDGARISIDRGVDRTGRMENLVSCSS